MALSFVQVGLLLEKLRTLGAFFSLLHFNDCKFYDNSMRSGSWCLHVKLLVLSLHIVDTFLQDHSLLCLP